MFSQLLLFTSSLNSALGWGVKELRIYDRWYCGRAAGWLLTTFLSSHFQYWRRGKKKKTEHSSLLCSLPELGITLLYETNCVSAGRTRWVIRPGHSDQYFWIYFCFSRDNCWLSPDIFSVVFCSSELSLIISDLNLEVILCTAMKAECWEVTFF